MEIINFIIFEKIENIINEFIYLIGKLEDKIIFLIEGSILKLVF